MRRHSECGTHLSTASNQRVSDRYLSLGRLSEELEGSTFRSRFDVLPHAGLHIQETPKLCVELEKL